ncbi:hypothetical protein ABPG72_011636 [Tetrahymena utriculariae]
MNLSNSFQQQFNLPVIISKIPPPQLPQQPSIKLLGSQPINLDIKQQYQQPQDQQYFQQQNFNQPAQIQQTQSINNQIYMQTYGSIQNIELKQSSRVMNSNTSSSSISSNSKFPYKVKNIIQEINFQSQNSNIPQARNRFLNNLPEQKQNPLLNNQIQYQIENGRSLSSNIILPTYGSQIIQNNNSNNNFIQARRNSNCSTQHNSSTQQNNSLNNPIIQSVSYGLPQVAIQQTSSFNKKVDHINEKILNNENKLKEFLQSKNTQFSSERNQIQFEGLNGSKNVQSIENSLKSQNVCLVNNKIKLSPEKNVIKTVITYVNQPQQLNYSQMQSHLNKSSVDSKSNLCNFTNPIQTIQDKQDNTSIYNINQLLDNSTFRQSNYISPSSVVNQSPTILRAYEQFDLNKSQNQSILSPVLQGQNIFTTQNIPKYIDQKPNLEVQKSASENSTQGEKQRQSPALTFAQMPNGSISRNSSTSDFQLNKQGSLGQQSQSPLSKSPISSGTQQLISKIPLIASSPINQIIDIKSQENEDQPETTSNKNNNQFATQNYLYKLKNSYFTPQNIDQSSTKNETNLIALSNNNISKTPSLNQTDLTPKNTPLINVQQTSSLSPSIQSPIQAIYSSNQLQNQQQQEDEQQKQIFIYQLNSPQSVKQSNSQSQLKEEPFNSEQFQKSKSASVSQYNQLSPISNKATSGLSEITQNAASQIPQINLDPQASACLNKQTTVNQNNIETKIQSSVDQSNPYILNKITENQKYYQTQPQFNSQNSQYPVQGIPPYTPLLFPAYKGIQNPLENLSLIQQRTFLSRQPSQENIQYASHSPARSVQSDIQRSNYLQSPFSVVEKQINLLKSRPNSLENNFNNLSQSPNPQNQDVVQRISLSQSPKTRGLTFQQSYQTQVPTISVPIIKSIITSSPEGIKSQKIQVFHNAQIPIAEGVSINAQVTTEHEIKDYQNYLRNSPSRNVKIIENIIIDNQQIQDSIDQKQNRVFTFQTISSPFPSTNQNIQYNYPSIKKDSGDIKQFANSPLRIQKDLNNNSSYFQNNDIQKVIGQFDSEDKQYQDLLNQIDCQAKDQIKTENRLLIQETPKAQNQYSNQLDLENEGQRKRQFSFQDNKNVKDSMFDKKQDKIIEENIDKLIGNIFKEAMNNVNQTINKKRDEFNQQFQTTGEQKKEEQAYNLEKINSQQSGQQVSQINQQIINQENNEMQNQEQSLNIKLDQNSFKNEEIPNINDQDESTKKSKQKNLQSEESQSQEIILENQKIVKQLKQQPTYLAKNLNTINELDGDALSVFKKIENASTFHLPLDDNKKKELAQSWQKPDYVQSLILGQLDKDKKQVKQVSSKKSLKNSLTQFSKPIDRSCGNSQSSIKQPESFSKSLKQNNSEIKNQKEDTLISNQYKTKGFLFKNNKDKSEQTFSKIPNIEQQFQNNSPQRFEIENKIDASEELVKKTQKQQTQQEKVFPFFQSQQNNYQRSINSPIQNSLSNSRQSSLDKQKSILDKIENTFEEAQAIESFGLQQNNTATQLEVKNVKNQRSVAQFQQPYPSHQTQSQTSSKQNSPQTQKLKKLPSNQDVEKDELQYLDKAPIQYPQNFQENDTQDTLLIPQYEESEKDKKYRNFLLKMLNNYKEKRQEILKKIERLNQKQQVKQFQSYPFNSNKILKNNSNFVEPQKLIYQPQKLNNDNYQFKQMSPKQTTLDMNNSQNKKNFDINKHINNAYQENEMQEQIQQYEMLIHNDTQSPANQRRNKESYLNSLLSSPDQANKQKQYYIKGNYSQSPDQNDNEDQNYSQLKGRKLRPCELKNILQSQKDSEKTTFKNEYYKNAKFKESPKKSKSPQTQQQHEKAPQFCSKIADRQNKLISSELDKYKINRKCVEKRNLNDIDNQYEVSNNQNKKNIKALSSSKSPNRSTKSPYQKQQLEDSKKQKQKNQEMNKMQTKTNKNIQKPEINKHKVDPKSQNQKYQDQSLLKVKNKVQDLQMNRKNIQNKKVNKLLLNKYSNQFEDQNSDFNQSQNLENKYPVYGQSNKNYQQFNIQLQNTFESQNQNSKEDFQVEVNQNCSDYSNKQNNKKNVQNVQKMGQKYLQNKNQQYPQNIQNHLNKSEKTCTNSKKGEKLLPYQNIIQNINDMQKYSEYMIENNQNLLKDLDQSLDRVSRNSSQHNRSRNNSNSAGRSIIKEIGSFFKYQKEQEISPLLRPKSDSAQIGQQYIDSRQSLSSPDRIQDSQNDQEFQHNSSNPINNKLYVQIRKTIHSISPPHSQEQQKGNYFNLPQYYSNNPQLVEIQRQHNKKHENRFEEDSQKEIQNQQKINLQQIQNIFQNNNKKLKKNVAQ